MSVCENCGAPLDLSGDVAIRCPFCHVVNAPAPKLVEVPVPVQVVNKVVAVAASSPEAVELRCPHCRRKLVTVSAADVELNGCGACGGIWIDNAGAKRIVENPRDVFTELAQRCARNAKDRGKRGERPACAVCQADLDVVTAPKTSVMLDICREHGTWFDAFELSALVQQLLHPRPTTAAQSSRDAVCVGCHAVIARDHANISERGPKCDACWRTEQDGLAAKPQTPEALGTMRMAPPADSAGAVAAGASVVWTAGQIAVDVLGIFL